MQCRLACPHLTTTISSSAGSFCASIKPAMRLATHRAESSRSCGRSSFICVRMETRRPGATRHRSRPLTRINPTSRGAKVPAYITYETIYQVANYSFKLLFRRNNDTRGGGYSCVILRSDVHGWHVYASIFCILSQRDRPSRPHR